MSVVPGVNSAETVTTASAGRERRPLWRRVASNPVTHLIAALVVIALVQALIVKLYQVPSGSMENTLRPGDRVLVNRLAYLGAEPAAGDVVVFDRPEGWAEPESDRGLLRTVAGWFGDVFGFGPSNSHAMAKRIVAGPGQTVECCDDAGRIVRDGVGVDEPYLSSNPTFTLGELDCDSVPRSPRCFPALTLPSDSYLMLGDNRAASSDSITPCRALDIESSLDCARLVPRDRIIGPAFFVLFPFDRWGQSMSPAATAARTQGEEGPFLRRGA